MKAAAAAALMTVICGMAFAGGGPWSFRGVILHDCHDGDTCTVTLRGKHPLFGARAKVRLLGIYAPEVDWRAKCPQEKAKGIVARDALLKLLRGARRINVVDVRGKDSFGRILGRMLADGVDTGAELVRAGLAATAPRDWCE